MMTQEERTLSIQQRHGKNFFAIEGIDPRIPYAMRGKKDAHISLVAIDICTNKAGQLCFFDFDRGRMLDGKFGKRHKDGSFVWKHERLDGSSDPLIFSPLTLEDFDEHLRQYCTDELSALLQDLDDVQVWYRKQAGIA